MCLTVCLCLSLNSSASLQPPGTLEKFLPIFIQGRLTLDWFIDTGLSERYSLSSIHLYLLVTQVARSQNYLFIISYIYLTCVYFLLPTLNPDVISKMYLLYRTLTMLIDHTWLVTQQQPLKPQQKYRKSLRSHSSSSSSKPSRFKCTGLSSVFTFHQDCLQQKSDCSMNHEFTKHILLFRFI